MSCQPRVNGQNYKIIQVKTRCKIGWSSWGRVCWLRASKIVGLKIFEDALIITLNVIVTKLTTKIKKVSRMVFFSSLTFSLHITLRARAGKSVTDVLPKSKQKPRGWAFWTKQKHHIKYMLFTKIILFFKYKINEYIYIGFVSLGNSFVTNMNQNPIEKGYLVKQQKCHYRLWFLKREV